MSCSLSQSGCCWGRKRSGIVTVETSGDGLETVVGLSVAIIAFGGVFALRIERIREASTASGAMQTKGL
ncbi:hypothetical protein GCM10008995_04760 [Halobellus salinus]|uniref:Uncharacterized protein n=1 Tax=Halobellus salinus TaxID=931585 RepID=A0A830E7M2_9EURY|nr:hypothetical protein [Halobellus salinus]GGI97906.1 hypothetical protein GCM10008995_04760 [Halobellus salinus]SMP06794.1 hypothetical protein SAMN06265347_102202 [Halobellus salinus]